MMLLVGQAFSQSNYFDKQYTIILEGIFIVVRRVVSVERKEGGMLRIVGPA